MRPNISHVSFFSGLSSKDVHKMFIIVVCLLVFLVFLFWDFDFLSSKRFMAFFLIFISLKYGIKRCSLSPSCVPFFYSEGETWGEVCCINCMEGKENSMERMNDNKCLRRIWLWKAIKKVFVAIQETLTKYWEGNPCLEIESNSSEGWRVIIVSLAFCFLSLERRTSSCIIFLRFQFPSPPVVVVVHWILCTLSSSSPLFLS